MLHDRRHCLARAPMRVSFVGGGTDLPEFWSRGQPGHVVSMAVDLYCYVSLKDMFDTNVRVHHSTIDTAPMASRVEHDYARVTLEEYGLFRGVELTMTSDVMVTGSGLGASSSLMTALISACRAFRQEQPLAPPELASEAFRLEGEAGTAGGLQDQYAAAHGGVNSMTFSEDGVEVTPLVLDHGTLSALTERLVLIYTNLARKPSMLKDSLRDTLSRSESQELLDRTLELSHAFEEELTSGTCDFDVLGRVIHEGWELKRRLNPFAINPYVDELYSELRDRGVLGGKLLGAGGGGFVLGLTAAGERDSVLYSLYPNFIGLRPGLAERGAEIVWQNWA